LALYWSPGYIITKYDVHAPLWMIPVTITTYTFGVFFHFVSDAQKDATLRVKKGLITEGVWSLSRNVNYFGELLIYGSFSSLAMHWFPLLVLFGFVAGYWYSRMAEKDKSLSRYKEFAQYKKNTALFIPKLF